MSVYSSKKLTMPGKLRHDVEFVVDKSDENGEKIDAVEKVDKKMKCRRSRVKNKQEWFCEREAQALV